MEDTIVLNGVTYKLVPAEPEPKPVEPPKPEYPDAAKWYKDGISRTYYSVTFHGSTHMFRDTACGFDKETIKNANAFTTKKAAQEQADRESLTRRIQRWRDANNTVRLDWEDGYQPKFYYHFWYTDKELAVNYAVTVSIPNVTYFSSSELANQCIAEFGDEIKRVFYGVDEEEKWT